MIGEQLKTQSFKLKNSPNSAARWERKLSRHGVSVSLDVIHVSVNDVSNFAEIHEPSKEKDGLLLLKILNEITSTCI